MSRTVVDISTSVDPWPVIDTWASANKFSVVSCGALDRIYERGGGFRRARIVVQVDSTPTGITLSAWAPYAITDTELDVLPLQPLNYFARRKARRLVNALLEELGQPRL